MNLLKDPARIRRIILWIMLGSLGLSAILAIVGILGNQFDQIARMISSAIASVAASLLLLWAARFLDSDKNHKTALFAMGLVLTQFVLFLLAMWDPLRIVSGGFGGGSEERFLQTALMFVPIAVPAGVFFHIRQFRGGHLAGTLGLISLVAAYPFCLVAIWINYTGRDNLEDHLWATGWACWFFALAAVATSAGAEIYKHHWRWIGLLIAGIAMVFGLRDVWGNSDFAYTPLAVAVALPSLIGYANLLFLCKLKPSQEWVRWGAIVFAFISDITLVYVAITKTSVEIFWRIGAATGVCAGCGIVAVTILAMFNRRPAPVGSDEVHATEIAVICPGCQKQQSILLKQGFGENSCPGCGMIFTIRARAPRCPSCNYILLMFHGDKCPECGSPVTRPEAQRAVTPT